MKNSPKTIEWVGDMAGHLRLLDQTRLPAEQTYLECRTVEDVWQAIRRLSVRGAPAIGVAAAYGVCLGLNEGRSVDDVCNYLATSRPTAANLFWALERMRGAAKTFTSGPAVPPSAPPVAPWSSQLVAKRLLAEAQAIHEEDRRLCAAIGRYGADLFERIPAGAGILTHCNAGALATSGDGTALAVIFELARRGRWPQVWVDETRPLLQGARLTMWELAQQDISATLICDSAAAHVMREGRVQAVITGADRIAANGDTANKIGTYGLATLARAHNIPFFVAAPSTTFDLSIDTGAKIPIEQRAAEEVTHGFGRQTAPDNARVYNPAFDVTPAELIAAIITEVGAFRPADAAAAVAEHLKSAARTNAILTM
jgi:methylthioribose-1-phosphate isomerase